MKRKKFESKEQKLSYVVDFCLIMGISSKRMVNTGGDDLSSIRWGKKNSRKLIKNFFKNQSRPTFEAWYC